jgi:hypothetical protein
MKKNQDYFGLKDARGLFARLQEGQPFRNYLLKRPRLVLPALAVFALVSLACAAATAVSFATLSPWLTLPGFLLAPVVLAGSLLAQALVFLSWLEQRALAQALGHRPRGRVGPLPRVPWPLVALALFVPLALLAGLWPIVALLLVAAAALVPVLYTRLDRAPRKPALTRQRAAV